MTPPAEILTALATLQAELTTLVASIDQLRADQKCMGSDVLSLPNFEKLQAIYRERDRLASAIGNLKAYYAGR